MPEDVSSEDRRESRKKGKCRTSARKGKGGKHGREVDAERKGEQNTMEVTRHGRTEDEE